MNILALEGEREFDITGETAPSLLLLFGAVPERMGRCQLYV